MLFRPNNWFVFVTLLHSGLLIFQIHAVQPIELAIFGGVANFASILFIPHAVRVIVAWLLGPKALLALVPSELIVTFCYSTQNIYDPTCYLIPILSASSAVIAFEVLKAVKINVFPGAGRTKEWRWVVLAGFLAALFISTTIIYLNGDATAPISGSGIFTRSLFGNMTGLLVSLLVLLVSLKYIKNTLQL
mgnify:FL=1